MSEPVQFWLDNKMSAGLKMAEIGGQALVVYREKFYVVEKEAAQTRGGKAVRYSKSSLPMTWKKALRGEVLPPDALAVPADDALPPPTVSTAKKTRPRKASEPQSEPAQAAPTAPVVPTRNASAPANSPAKDTKKMTIKPIAQTSVSAACPECGFKHEFPLEKGKNGKPFFTACSRCKAEFAVRFVPAMIYQAQVAGFR